MGPFSARYGETKGEEVNRTYSEKDLHRTRQWDFDLAGLFNDLFRLIT